MDRSESGSHSYGSAFRDCNEGVEKRKSGRKKREDAWRRLTSPDVFGMIAQERSPVLSSRLCSANASHIRLNRSFRYPNIQLEQLATNALSSEDGGCLLPF